jgi:hypothetical protein
MKSSVQSSKFDVQGSKFIPDTHTDTLIPKGARPHSVRYYWSTAGTVCSGHTVVIGKTRNAALAAFFTTNPHVQEAA